MRADLELDAKKTIWDRRWNHFRVAAVLPGDPEGAGDGANLPANDGSSGNGLPDWCGYVLELPTPILGLIDIPEAIELRDARIYPPFKLNDKASHESLFSDVKIPTNERTGCRSIPVPEHAVKGVAIELQSNQVGDPLSGIRLDCKRGTNLDLVVANLLAAVRLYTHQWWVSSQRNPFDAGIRMSFDLDRDFMPKEVPRVRGREPVQSSWFGHAATQQFIGIEKVLDRTLWTNIGQHLARELPTENGLAFFFDAINDFMGFEDNECIMHLALAYEVSENKARIMNGQSPRSKNKQLLNSPTLAKGKLGATFRQIITDRDNIAHGRNPYHLAKDPGLIDAYLSAGLELSEIYLRKCADFGWIDALKLSIDRKAE